MDAPEFARCVAKSGDPSVRHTHNIQGIIKWTTIKEKLVNTP